MKSNWLKSLLSNKIFLIVFSLLAALVLWIIVVLKVSPEITRTIYNVPVTMPESGAAFQSLGLDITNADRDNLTVNITVVGERNIVGSLNRDSFTVTPSFSAVTEQGTYELALQVTKSSQFLNYTIKNISPAYVTLTFAPVISRTYKVSVSTGSITAPKGYLVSTISALPAEVTVTATEEAIAKIASVSATVTNVSELDKTYTAVCQLELLDSSGEVIDKSNYRFDYSSVDVTIPVYKLGTQHFDIDFINVPDGFDLSSLEYVLSNESIPVAAAESVIDTLSTKVLGYIDLAEFDFGREYAFGVNLGAGMVNIDNVTSVTVTFPRDNIKSKRVNVTNIRFVNGSDQYSYVLHTPKLNGVTVIGSSDEIDLVLASSVIAVVDLSAISLQTGMNTIPVSFEIPAFSRSWAVGSLTVSVEVIPN